MVCRKAGDTVRLKVVCKKADDAVLKMVCKKVGDTVRLKKEETSYISLDTKRKYLNKTKYKETL